MDACVLGTRRGPDMSPLFSMVEWPPRDQQAHIWARSTQGSKPAVATIEVQERYKPLHWLNLPAKVTKAKHY